MLTLRHADQPEPRRQVAISDLHVVRELLLRCGLPVTDDGNAAARAFCSCSTSSGCWSTHRLEPRQCVRNEHRPRRHALLTSWFAITNCPSERIRAGLVDEYQLFVGPAIVGGGNPFFPDDVRVDLELLDERRFGNGVVYLRYGVKDHGQRG